MTTICSAAAVHAALLVLAGMSPPRPRALPGTPTTALGSASNYRFEVECDNRRGLVQHSFNAAVHLLYAGKSRCRRAPNALTLLPMALRATLCQGRGDNQNQ
jgi:hypothetical protein